MRTLTVIFISLLAAATAFFPLDCGAPLNPGAASWVERGLFPEYFYVNALTAATGVADPHNVYAAGQLGDNAVIIRYDGVNFVAEYARPGGGWNNGVRDVGFLNGKGWAGTSAYSDGRTVPVLLSREDDGWREIPLEGAGGSEGWVNNVYIIGDRSLWLLIFRMGKGYYLYKYTDGDLESYPQPGEVSSAAFARERNIIYCLANEHDKHTLYLSGDGGGYWYTENVAFDTLGYELESLRVAFAAGDEVYFVATFQGEFAGLVRRGGSPGAGVYDLVFLSNQNENFLGLEDAARDEAGSICAVGAQTSVLFKDGQWVEEFLPSRTSFTHITAAPTGGFFAAGYDSIFTKRTELLYHP